MPLLKFVLPEQSEPKPSNDVDTKLMFPGIKPVPFAPGDFEKKVKIEDVVSNNAVHKCFHKIANMDVVLKEVSVTGDYAVKCIQREVHVLNKIRENPHKFLIDYYGCGYNEISRDYYLCTEVMDGSLVSLEGKMGKAYKSPKILRYINYAVVNALDHLHESHQIIHRDIKPANILFRIRKSASINSNEMLLSIKLTDFGISRVLIDNGASTAMNSTLKYRAPERNNDQPIRDLEEKKWKEPKKYGVETDIWSLGLTILEMALGEYPLKQRVEKQDISQVLQEYATTPFAIIDESRIQFANLAKSVLIKYLKLCIAPSGQRAKVYADLKEADYVAKFENNAGLSYDKMSGEYKYIS